MDQNTEVINNEAPIDVAAIVAEAGADAALQDKSPGTAEGASEISAASPDYETEASELVEFAYESLTPLYPSLVTVYTIDIRQKLAMRSAKLMEKYGLTMGEFMGKWGDEIMFLVLVVPLASKTYIAIQHDNAVSEKQDTTKTEAAAVSSPMQPIIDATAPDALHLKI